MRRQVLTVVLGVLVLSALVSALLLRSVELPAPKPATRHAAQVVSPAVESEKGFVGVLLPDDVVSLSPRLEGLLVEVRARIGQRVARGDVLARLDEASTKRELRVALARVETIRAEALRIDLERQQALERASAALSASKYLNPEERSAPVYAAKLATARAAGVRGQLAEAQLRVEQLEEQLRDCVVLSPVDGVVVDRLVEPGVTIDRRTVVFKLSGEQAPRVRFAVPEVSAARLVVGMELLVVSARSSTSAKLSGIAPHLDPASRTLIAEGTINPSPTTPPGSIVRVYPVAAPAPSPISQATHE